MMKRLLTTVVALLLASPALAGQVPHPVNGAASSTAGHLAGFAGSTGDQLEDIQLGTGLSLAGTTLSAVAAPGGTSGQVQYNNAGVLGGFTLGGDCTVTVATGVIVCTKTNGVAFGALATESAITLGQLPGLAATDFWVGGAGGAAAAVAMSGDCALASSGAVTCTIPLNHIAGIAQNTVLGSITAGTNAPVALTAAQVTSVCQAFTSTLSGCVPASGGGTANFMRADGTWAAPTAAAGGTNGQIEYDNAGALGGFTMGGDCTLVTSTGVITCTKTNGTAFGTAATQNTGTSGATLPFLNGTNTWSGVQTFGEVLGAVSSQSGTTYTFAASDCGTTVQFTNAAAVTATFPNSLPVGCHIAIEQEGAGQVTLAAGVSATLRSPHSFTKTFGQYAIIGVSILTNAGGAAAVGYFVGDGA